MAFRCMRAVDRDIYGLGAVGEMAISVLEAFFQGVSSLGGGCDSWMQCNM